MEAENREKGFWTRINRKLHVIREELKRDSVAENPVEPVNCCSPPVPRKTVSNDRKG